MNRLAVQFLEGLAMTAALIIGAALVAGVLMLLGYSLLTLITPSPAIRLRERLLGFLGVCVGGALVTLFLIATSGTS